MWHWLRIRLLRWLLARHIDKANNARHWASDQLMINPDSQNTLHLWMMRDAEYWLLLSITEQI
jgi:hypothetical protein